METSSLLCFCREKMFDEVTQEVFLNIEDAVERLRWPTDSHTVMQVPSLEGRWDLWLSFNQSTLGGDDVCESVCVCVCVCIACVIMLCKIETPVVLEDTHALPGFEEAPVNHHLEGAVRQRAEGNLRLMASKKLRPPLWHSAGNGMLPAAMWAWKYSLPQWSLSEITDPSWHLDCTFMTCRDSKQRTPRAVP